jgi:hypothetical protein
MKSDNRATNQPVRCLVLSILCVVASVCGHCALSRGGGEVVVAGMTVGNLFSAVLNVTALHAATGFQRFHL